MKQPTVVKSFEDLYVYSLSRAFSKKVSELIKLLPQHEEYNLKSQMRRAKLSVTNNIAEGYGRRTTGEYIQALYVGYGSQCELETQVLLAGDLGFIKPENLEILKEDLGDVERMLKGLIRSLEKRP